MKTHGGNRLMRASALCCVIALAAACGSTLPRAARLGGQAAQGLGSSGGTTPGSVGSADASGQTSTGASAGASAGSTGPAGSGGTALGAGNSGGAGSSGATSAAASGSSTGAGDGSIVAPSGTSQASGPGVTPTSIYVGVIYAVNNDAINKAAGANGATSGNTQADANAVIDDINTHGGVAGRKLVPVWFAFDSTSTSTVDSQYQSACAKFTQDSPKVFAVIGQGVASYRRCIAKAGVVQIDTDLPDIAASEFQQYPALIELGYPNLNRIAAEQVAALADQKYFSPWDKNVGAAGATRAKVGIITYDDDAHTQAVDKVLIPGLRQLGYDPGSNVARITPISKASDYGSQAASVQSAELKFASAGVDHVIMFESNGGLSLFFMLQAGSQHYHPRYGVNSTSGLEVLLNAGDIPKDQANGAIGYGWIPGLDLTADRNTDTGPYSNQARRDCLKVMKAHGQTFADTNAEAIALAFCSNLYLLPEALASTPSVINASTFTQAINKLGTSVLVGGALGELLSPTQHDGIAKIYYWDYFADCTCMHYTGSLRTIP